jgi:hypothetical protein
MGAKGRLGKKRIGSVLFFYGPTVLTTMGICNVMAFLPSLVA